MWMVVAGTAMLQLVARPRAAATAATAAAAAAAAVAAHVFLAWQWIKARVLYSYTFAVGPPCTSLFVCSKLMLCTVEDQHPAHY
jgi:hypothetical protein